MFSNKITANVLHVFILGCDLMDEKLVVTQIS